MTNIKLKDLEYYIGCNQENRWFFCTISNEIENIKDIVSKLSINEKDFTDNCFYYEYIPLPSLEITIAFDDFISTLNNKKVSAYFKDTDKSDAKEYWLKFDKIFHTGFERRLWDEYYDKYVHSKAVSWCKEYNISNQ